MPSSSASKEIVIAITRKQAEVLTASEPTVVLQGGAGCGKTMGGVFWAIAQAGQQPRSRGMIVAATYPMLSQSIVPYLEHLGQETGLIERWDWRRAERAIYLPNGSMFWLRSADTPEALLGADLAWLYGDEVALWKREAYRYCISRLRQPGYEHRALFTFTPKGRNWAYDELGTERPGLRIIRATTRDNPHLPPDFIERLRRDYGEGTAIWRQEVEGEFVAFEGLVYPMFSQELHVVQPPDTADYVRTVAGVDWGWTNPGVILVVGQDNAGHLWVLDERYETEQSVEWWAAQAGELRDRWHISAFYCDPSEPANIEAFRRASLPADRANNTVMPGIAAVASRLENTELHISPRCGNLIREMLCYCYRRERDGTPRRDEPEKVNDHAVDALRYAVMGIISAPRLEVRFL